MAAMEKGADLEEFTFEIAEPGPNECIIKVETCGVCYSDIHLLNDDWKLSKVPLVPGHEIIGKIIRNGKGRWMGKLNFQILLASAWAVRHY